MIRKHSPAFAVLALVAACANPWTVDSFEAPEADLAGKRSFAWRGGEVAAPTLLPPELVAETESLMRAAITAELLRKGYVEAAEADMVVSFQVSGVRRYVEAERQRIGAPSPNELLTPGGVEMRPASELPPEKSVREGTVVVFAEDPASGKLLWRGLVSAELRTPNSEATLRQVADMGRHITEGFPPRRGAQ